MKTHPLQPSLIDMTTLSNVIFLGLHALSYILVLLFWLTGLDVLHIAFLYGASLLIVCATMDISGFTRFYRQRRLYVLMLHVFVVAALAALHPLAQQDGWLVLLLYSAVSLFFVKVLAPIIFKACEPEGEDRNWEYLAMATKIVYPTRPFIFFALYICFALHPAFIGCQCETYKSVFPGFSPCR